MSTHPNFLRAPAAVPATLPEPEPIIEEREEAIVPPPATDTPDLAAWKRQPYSVLAGTAGTGKSFFAREWAASTKGVVLAATTGIAAINLGGITINGLLGYYDTASLRDSYVAGFLELRLRKWHKSGLRRIVLDEMSMLDAEQLTLLTKALEDVAGRGYAMAGDVDDEDEGQLENASSEDAENENPISLTLVGDFAQLPPVKAPFAFESPEWERYQAHCLTLTEIKRQADRDFIEALQAVRVGDGARALPFFQDRFQTTTDQHFPGPTLFAKNEQVGRFNMLRHEELTSTLHQFHGRSWLTPGRKEPGEWKNIPRGRDGQPLIQLKEGALVMILANKPDLDMPGSFTYVNGDLGELVGPTAIGNCANVRLHRTGEVVMVAPVTREIKIPLEVGRRKALKAEGHGDRVEGRWEIVGGITYMPLRLAYATTVHKSQGLSLDQVQININDGFFSTPGMLFVALSRARTSEGLRIVGSPAAFLARCTVDPKVKGWL